MTEKNTSSLTEKTEFLFFPMSLFSVLPGVVGLFRFPSPNETVSWVEIGSRREHLKKPTESAFQQELCVSYLLRAGRKRATKAPPSVRPFRTDRTLLFVSVCWLVRPALPGIKGLSGPRLRAPLQVSRKKGDGQGSSQQTGAVEACNTVLCVSYRLSFLVHFSSTLLSLKRLL